MQTEMQTRMQSDQSLVSGQRYSFVMDDGAFRADFVDIIGDTLRVDNHEQDVKWKKCMWTIPLEWITHVVTLDSITHYRFPLPTELVDIVDSYV